MFWKRETPSSAHISAARERTVEPLVDQARATGTQVARSVDADYGATRPAEAWVVDRTGGAEAVGLLPDFHERSTRHEEVLHRRGPEMITARARRDEAKKTRDRAAEAQKKTAKKLSGNEKHHRFSGPGAALYGKALMMGIAVCDVALTALVLELLGLPTLTTWVIAAGLGIVQLLILHHVGEMVASSSDSDGGSEKGGAGRAKGITRNGLVLVAAAVPVLALAVLMAWLRADYLALQNAELGDGSGTVSFGVAMATFCVMQLVLDAFAFILGYRIGAPIVKAALAASRAARREERRYSGRFRGAQRPADRSEARFGAAYAEALGWPDLCAGTVLKAWAERRAASSGLYAGICSAADPLTAAAFSEAAQLEGCDDESEARITEALRIIAERRAALDAMAAGYGFDTSSSQHGKAAETAENENEAAADETGEEIAAAEAPGNNGKAAHPAKITI